MNDQKEMEQLAETFVSSEEKYKGVLLHVFRDEVRLPSGRMTAREYLKHGGAVCMVAVTDEGNVIMERQYRYPIGKVITEIPAGKLDSPQEDRLEAAKRELREETGYTADHWTFMGHYYSTPAYTTEDITMYLATGLHKGDRHLDEGEFLNVFEVPVKELVQDILDNKIADGKTQAAVLKAYAILQADHRE